MGEAQCRFARSLPRSNGRTSRRVAGESIDLTQHHTTLQLPFCCFII